jgi:phosphopantothenoylcysteine decarboxylase/phosphopantothenate--cysteine ligase
VKIPFEGKRILLGVSGSIAAYKSVDLASKLTQAGALVDVLLSHSAAEFVRPLTFRSLTHRVVVSNLFDPDSPEAVEHIALAKAADALVVAPATAHMIAKLALGLADDPISVTALATSAPLLVAPAMDGNMWEHPAVRQNVATLVERGAVIAGPGQGRLASGLHGWGRLLETPELMGRVAQMLGRSGTLAGRSLVVTAGGTEEPIDPVRVVTNRSSGKMGYAIAEAARDQGASVTLIVAPTALDDPAGVDTQHVDTAEEMRDAVLRACDGADALVMAAAVADYRPAEPSADKLKKQNAGSLSIAMERTADILTESPRSLVRVGFAAESASLIENAKAKLASKELDLIVANDITLPDAVFGADTNKVTLIDGKGQTDLPLMSKYEVAGHILERVALALSARRARAAQ